MNITKSITGREFRVTHNKSKRTFTIRSNWSVYKTYRMSREEFQDSLHHTGNDWAQYLKSSENYYKRN